MHLTSKGASIVAALALAAATAASPAGAQSVLRPIEARIVNTPSQTVPVSVAPTPLSPVMARCFEFLIGGSANCLLYEIPDGKRLVIESVSWQLVTSATAHVTTLVVGSPDGGSANVLIGAKAHVVATPRTYVGEGIAFYVGTQPMKLYLDGPARVLASVSTLGSTANSQQNVAIAGLLLDK
jgi:hypothetical protein